MNGINKSIPFNRYSVLRTLSTKRILSLIKKFCNLAGLKIYIQKVGFLCTNEKEIKETILMITVYHLNEKQY